MLQRWVFMVERVLPSTTRARRCVRAVWLVAGLRISVENQAKSLHAVTYWKVEQFKEFAFHVIDGCEEARVPPRWCCSARAGRDVLAPTPFAGRVQGEPQRSPRLLAHLWNILPRSDVAAHVLLAGLG
jgi:hypothetical protein